MSILWAESLGFLLAISDLSGSEATPWGEVVPGVEQTSPRGGVNCKIDGLVRGA